MLELLKARGVLPKFQSAVDVFCLVEDEALRAESLLLIAQLREAGCAVDYSLTPLKPDKQFKRALELGALATAKVERTPEGGCQVRIKDLRTRTERTLALNDATQSIRREFGR